MTDVNVSAIIADKLFETIQPYLRPLVNHQEVRHLLYTTLITVPYGATAPTAKDTIDLAGSPIETVRAQDLQAFDVAGDQPVKNMPATAKMRAQVRMGHRE